MRLPAPLQRVLCRLGWHSWNRTRRSGLLRRRRCPVCGTRQMKFDDGTYWVIEPKGLKIPRTRLDVVTGEVSTEEERRDFERGLEPL